MATEFIFDGKKIKLPGAYSTIVSGEKNPPLALDYGKVLVIDTGLGATWGGGSGIDGTLAEGQDAVYEFDNVSDYRSFLKGGIFWKMADALFRPDVEAGAFGASKVLHLRTATTTPASLTFTTTAGGTFKLDCKDEGVIGNGVLTAGHLDKGYAYTIETGSIDTNKWVFKIWLGSWTGNHTDGIAFDEVDKDKATALLVAESPEFNTVGALIDWAKTDNKLGARFALNATSAVVGAGTVSSGDVSGLSGYQIAIGGTETYSSANLTKALTALAEEDFSFIISDKYGTVNYNSTENGLIKAHIINEARFKRFMFVGGGKDADEFAGAGGSLAMCSYFNNPYIHVVHGDVGEASTRSADGFRRFPSICTVAKIVGRIAGKEPQVPITEKTIGIDKLYHNLSKLEKERAVDAGLICLYNKKSINKFAVLQGINTLQDNKTLFTNQGKSHSIQFMRVIEQINKELVINAEIDLLSDENGVNSSTLSAGILKNWTETYLQSRVATENTDNLLLSFRNVTVEKRGDAYFVSYGIVVNNEINKIFFTGFLFSK